MAQKGSGVVQALLSILNDFAKPGLSGVAIAFGQDWGIAGPFRFWHRPAKMGDEELRIAAVWALSQFHEPEVLPILLSEAETSPSCDPKLFGEHLGHVSRSARGPHALEIGRAPEPGSRLSSGLCIRGNSGGREGISVLKKRHGARGDALLRAASVFFSKTSGFQNRRGGARLFYR